MARTTARHPTETELLILKILWTRGESSVRQVRDALADAHQKRAHTSVMTVMGIMTRKGYLRRRKTTDGYLYTPKITERDTRRGMLRDLVQRVFAGSTMSAVLQLLDERELNHEEVRELKSMIERKSKEKP